MDIFADLHIHSPYSTGTSINMTLENLDRYARMKGIDVLGTGDITHPRWLTQLKQKLVPSTPEQNGIYLLKNKSRGLNFILSGEVSNNFHYEGRSKRIHNVILVPSFSILEQINEHLSEYGNLAANGRPDLQLDCESMIKELKAISPRIQIIAAHIWTSYFSCLGARGFNSLSECYGKQTDKLLALETGLSSDPPMCWRIPELDKFPLVSNSDCHSPYPSRIGREANQLCIEYMSFSNIINSIQDRKGAKQFQRTIETFPEYGKYHLTGHRADRKFKKNKIWKTHVHDQIFAPHDAMSLENRCPVCNQRMTIGVLQRVTQLGPRDSEYQPKEFVPYKHLIPLMELIAFAKGIRTVMAKGVWKIYTDLIQQFGSEFHLMLNTSNEELKRIEDINVRHIIIKLRNQELIVKPGFDGVYGYPMLSTETKDIDSSSTKNSVGIRQNNKQRSLGDFI